MNTSVIGAGILSIITESLYDKPIVVFREYVQNAIDSFRRINDAECKLCCKIEKKNQDIYFLDNGAGICEKDFETKMKSIAWSEKDKTNDIGYKGIGRLAGISYCDKLTFYNILNYKEKEYQKFTVDAKKYYEMKNNPQNNKLTFEQIMDKIGKCSKEKGEIPFLEQSTEMFSKRNTGFLVVMSNIKKVLSDTVEEENFIENLGWLLPVGFKPELLNGEHKVLFKNIISENISSISDGAYNVKFNDKIINRPITESMLRELNCRFELGSYAVGFSSFPEGKMIVNRSNIFKGIKLYLDNMLLCDETEIVPMLKQLGLTTHTVNELIVTVRSIGVVIYITNKIDIIANARRTFIEVTDEDSIKFLKLVADYIERIYQARYSMSRFCTAKDNINVSVEKLEELRQVAQENLRKLAENKIELSIGDKKEFINLTDDEKKRKIKQKISNEMNKRIKEYLEQITEYDYDNAYDNFRAWLSRN